jgi:hypothetical protein
MQGVEIWNRWREEHPAISPDLRDAYLPHAFLRGANLSDVNFGGADLHKADLCEADLRRTDLGGTWQEDMHLDDTTEVEGMWHIVWLIALSESGEEPIRTIPENPPLAEKLKSFLSPEAAWRRNLKQTNLSGANLQKANLQKAKLHMVNLCEAQLQVVLQKLIVGHIVPSHHRI